MRSRKIMIAVAVAAMLAAFAYIARISIRTAAAGGRSGERARQINDAFRQAEDALGK